MAQQCQNKSPAHNTY